ncbi:MAG: winged helix-turn-helix domain-containing protein [Pseudomonadales bacterium]|nr:winged helix-turn-helix domain-containing protein [Pseudomonadales bacterium]
MTDYSRPQTGSDHSAAIHASENQAESQPGRSSCEQGFYLDSWQVTPALNQISHRQQPLERHLEPRLMKLLCLLAARPGQVLSREELVAELWPRVIVNENSLTRAVSELRKLLQTEDFPARDKLRTIPKRGYRLTASVSVVRPAQAQPDADRIEDDYLAEAAETAQSTPASPGRLGRIWLSKKRPAIWSNPAGQLTAATALSLALSLSIGLSESGIERLPQSQLIPAAAQSESTATDNPLLRDEIVMGQQSLLAEQVQLSSSWNEELPGVGVQNPVIAADGDRFAYLKQDLSGSTVYLGQISSEQSPLPIYHSSARLSRLTWSPLGNALLFTRDCKLQTATAFEASGQQQALYSLNLETLQVRRLIEEDQRQPGAAPSSNLTFAPTSIPLSPA